MSDLRRLNWGCGEWAPEGWTNSDVKEGPGVVAADIRDGLPFDADTFDYAVSIHALPEIAYPDLVPALGELRRVIKPDSVLRLALPDLVKGVRAYERGDRGYFLIPDGEMSSIGGKLVAQLVWYGYSRSLFVADFVEELLLKAGYTRVCHVAFGQTASRYPEIVELDNRDAESLFVEAVK